MINYFQEVMNKIIRVKFYFLCFQQRILKFLNPKLFNFYIFITLAVILYLMSNLFSI